MTQTIEIEAPNEDKTFDPNEIKRIIEALLFASSDPISLRKIGNIVNLDSKTLKQLLEEMKEQYIAENRVYHLEEIAKGYVLRTQEEFSPYIRQLLSTVKKDRLSHAALEALAIIAYRQPITRTQIDEIRGVDSSGIIYSLLERQLIESVGKAEVPGRPTLFGVTQKFLTHFGLKDLKELPKIEE